MRNRVRLEYVNLSIPPAYLFAMAFNHLGNYDGNGLSYESLGDGVQLKSVAKEYQHGFQYVAIYRSRRPQADVQAALN